MRRILLSAALIFLACSSLSATEALVFSGGDYQIHAYIGMADKPAVGQVHFYPPGGKDRIVLGPEDLQIEKFDMKKEVLVMRFLNKKNDPEKPPSFTLSIKKKKAVLTIAGRKIVDNDFSWEM